MNIESNITSLPEARKLPEVDQDANTTVPDFVKGSIETFMDEDSEGVRRVMKIVASDYGDLCKLHVSNFGE